MDSLPYGIGRLRHHRYVNSQPSANKRMVRANNTRGQSSEVEVTKTAFSRVM